jgi:hypothetical protein
MKKHVRVAEIVRHHHDHVGWRSRSRQGDQEREEQDADVHRKRRRQCPTALPDTPHRLQLLRTNLKYREAR